MTLFSKMAEKIAARIEQTAADALESINVKVKGHIQKERYDICLSCDKLYLPSKTCKVCGCFMNIKTWMPKQSCPLKKWEAVTDESVIDRK